MRTQLPFRAVQPPVSVSRPATTAAAVYTPAELAKAKVPFGLARWYHCTGAKITKPSLLDAARLEQVNMAVAAA